MFKAQTPPPPELFVPSCRLVQPATSSFYAKLEQTLQSFSFASEARQLCAASYSGNGRGRPGIDPAVYFKMLMVGFFENIASERGIAARCQDSISIRAFLGYDLTGDTPDHTTLSVIRARLGVEVYERVFVLILRALQQHGLVKGRNVGIDASVIAANASLKGLVNRQTEEAYWDYVRRLASENGIDPKDSDAVRRFDRKRPKKMSNQDWENPNDPDAKIGPTKTGATDMIYKPENTVDLDTGTILKAEVRPGDEADQKDMALHVLEAQENINEVQNLPAGTLTIESATADKGYHAVPELGFLQQEGIRTVISDPVRNRKMEKLTPEESKVVRSAKRSAKSKSGKELLRRRGMHLERFFAHGLDAGGARRTTLRGLANLNKRFKFSAAIYNLSQLMRKLLGVGTPKQWAARAEGLFWLIWRLFLEGWFRMAGKIESQLEKYWLLLVGPMEDRGTGFGFLAPSHPLLPKSPYINRLLGMDMAGRGTPRLARSLRCLTWANRACCILLLHHVCLRQLAA
jgi:transposase